MTFDYQLNRCNTKRTSSSVISWFFTVCCITAAFITAAPVTLAADAADTTSLTANIDVFSAAQTNMCLQ